MSRNYRGWFAISWNNFWTRLSSHDFSTSGQSCSPFLCLALDKAKPLHLVSSFSHCAPWMMFKNVISRLYTRPSLCKVRTAPNGFGRVRHLGLKTFHTPPCFIGCLISPAGPWGSIVTSHPSLKLQGLTARSGIWNDSGGSSSILFSRRLT